MKKSIIKKQPRAKQGCNTDPAKSAPSIMKVRDHYKQFAAKNLAFLIAFFKALNMSPQDYGRVVANQELAKTARTGSSMMVSTKRHPGNRKWRGVVNNYATQLRTPLKKDNMKLSKAQEILGHFGLTVKVSLYMPGRPKGQPADPNYRVNIPEGYTVSAPPMEDDSEVAFLKRFMIENSLSQEELGRAVGFTHGAVRNWLNSDDIMISHIISIKEYYGAIVEFDIIPLKDE